MGRSFYITQRNNALSKRIKEGGNKMKQKKNNRFLAMLMAMLMIVSTVATGWYPVVAKADTNTGITLTVIGDTGNHSKNLDEHTGYVYWLKDQPLNIDVNSLESYYVAGKTVEDQIKAALKEAKIDYHFFQMKAAATQMI